MNVLVLGKDPQLLEAGEPRERHLFYAQRLRARFPGSELRVLTYAPPGSPEVNSENLRILGSASKHRATFFFDVRRRLPVLLADGWRPDVVTTQTPWEEGVIGARLARRLGARFIPQVHFELFSSEWRREHWLNPWRAGVARRTLPEAHRVRVVSRGIGERIAAECGIAQAKIAVVPVGVRFAAAPRAGAGGKTVLFVGRLYEAKNLPLWVDAAARVARAEPAARFTIVGDGPGETDLRERVRAAGLTARFSFLGRKAHAELPPIYAAADVFLLSSNYEGFGRVVLEAMLAGLPVVSTRCSGPEDLVEDARTGYLVPRGDAAGLAVKVLDVLGHEEAARAMGEAGRRRAEALYGREALAERLIDLWAAA